MKKIILFFIISMSAPTISGYAQTPGTLKWLLQLEGNIQNCPALSSDETIYVPAGEDKIYAVNQDGTVKWQYSVDVPERVSSPAIGKDGVMYVAMYSFMDSFHALNPDGSQKWSYAGFYVFSSSPAIGSDGTIYVGCYDDNLYAIKPDGTLKWTFPTGDDIFSSPAIGTDGTIYFGSFDHNLYAVNPDSTNKWIFTTDGKIFSSPALGVDGIIYTASSDDNLYAINTDGSLKWKFHSASGSLGSPSVGSDGTVYITSDDSLYAIDMDGVLKWSFSDSWSSSSSPVIGEDGMVYFGADEKLFCLDYYGSKKWEFESNGFYVSSSFVIADSTIFVGFDDELYAIHCSSKEVAKNFWPKSHQNNQNTGTANSTIYLGLDDDINFSFFTNNQIVKKTVEVKNPTSKTINLINCEFDNPVFSLETGLPVEVLSKSKIDMTIIIQPDSTRLYRSNTQLLYESALDTNSTSTQISSGLFLDDGTELAYMSHMAVAAYDSCRLEDANSIATKNNLAVLYRFLGQPIVAEQNLLEALSEGINKKYGYNGMMMNMGVIKSDLNVTSEAVDFYDLAFRDIAASSDTAVLSPQIHYNLAWEAYANDSLTVALEKLNTVINANLTNDFLKAKAYVLRGAVQYRLGNDMASKADFNQAKSFDPGGPIAKLADENLLIVAVNEFEENKNIPKSFVLEQNYPNPFNPVTTICFDVSKTSRVVISIFDLLGREVKKLTNRNYQPGSFSIIWDGTNFKSERLSSGTYIIRMKAGNFIKVKKIILLR